MARGGSGRNETEDFAHRCAKVGLSEGATDAAWGRIAFLKIGPDDLEANQIIAGTFAKEQADRMEKLVGNLPAILRESLAEWDAGLDVSISNIEGAVRNASTVAGQTTMSQTQACLAETEKVTRQLVTSAQGEVLASRKQVEAARAELEVVREQIKLEVAKGNNAAKKRSNEAKAFSDDMQAGLLRAGADALESVAKSHVTSNRNKWVAATMGIAAAVGLTLGAAGYVAGSRSVHSTIAQVEAMVSRGDGAAWLNLMDANRNVTANLTTYCGSGSPNVHRENGGEWCPLPLWTRQGGTVDTYPGRPAEAAVIAVVVRDWLQANLGTWGLIGATVALLMLLRAVLGALVRVPLVRWLFALPPPPLSMTLPR